MLQIPRVALAAVVAATLPVVANASSASFSFDWFFDVDITAPGATFEVIEEDAFADSFSLGTGVVSASFTPDPFVNDPEDYEISGEGSGSATDTGLAGAFTFAALSIDVINETTADITATVAWSFGGSASAVAIADTIFADAFSGVLADFIISAPDTTDDVDEFIELFADSVFGFDEDEVSGSGTFVIGAGEALFVDAFVDAGGVAVVVPLPASLALGLAGLAGLGLLRARRRG